MTKEELRDLVRDPERLSKHYDGATHFINSEAHAWSAPAAGLELGTPGAPGVPSSPQIREWYGT